MEPEFMYESTKTPENRNGNISIDCTQMQARSS
jgi:hypothetical protein